MFSLAASSGAAERARGMGPPAAWLAHLDAGAAPDPPHRDWKDLFLAVRGAMTLTGEDRGDLIIGHAIAGKIEHTVAHFRSSGELGDGVDPHLDFEIGHGTAAPDDPDRGDIVLAAIEHDFFDETPQ